MEDIAAALSAIHNSPNWLCDHLLKHNTYFMREDENITFRSLLETNYRNLVNKICQIRRPQRNHCFSIEFRNCYRYFSIIRDIYHLKLSSNYFVIYEIYRVRKKGRK